MSATELIAVIVAILCAIGFAALVLVLNRVLLALGQLQEQLDTLSDSVLPLVLDLESSTLQVREAVEEARQDLDRFDRVLGSAEAISEVVSDTGRIARAAFAVPIIKTASVAAGTRQALRRLRGKRNDDYTDGGQR